MGKVQQPVKSQHARTQQSGGRLIALRIAWVFVTLWTLTIFVVGLRDRWSDLEAIFLADYAEALQELGFSAQLLATYAFSLEFIFMFVLLESARCSSSSDPMIGWLAWCLYRWLLDR